MPSSPTKRSYQSISPTDDPYDNSEPPFNPLPNRYPLSSPFPHPSSPLATLSSPNSTHVPKKLRLVSSPPKSLRIESYSQTFKSDKIKGEEERLKYATAYAQNLDQANSLSEKDTLVERRDSAPSGSHLIPLVRLHPYQQEIDHHRNPHQKRTA